MNPNGRTVKVIETSLARLESDAGTSAPDGESVAMAALGLLDEVRRLEKKKWVEQVAAGSPRRKPTDYAVMEGWCRRWLRATATLVNFPAEVAKMLTAQRTSVEEDLRSGRFRTPAAAMRRSGNGLG